MLLIFSLFPLALSTLGWLLSVLLGLLSSVLLLECLGGIRSHYNTLETSRNKEKVTPLTPNQTASTNCFDNITHNVIGNFVSNVTKTVVMIPAHNEESGIYDTIVRLMTQLSDSQEIVVIADNCTDRTAQVARSTGVRVIERDNAIDRGKGYALDYGIKALANNPPDVVVFVDGDCQVAPGMVSALEECALASSCPVQGTNLVTPPNPNRPQDKVSAFAFKVKNLVRPLGLEQFGVSSLLMGTGMALPWSVLVGADLANGDLVEDKKLGIDLLVDGYPTVFCPTAQVTSALPSAGSAATSQRTRWEHGHLQVIRTYVPRLLGQAIVQRRLDLLGAAIDLLIPPLSMLVLLSGVVLAFTGVVGQLSGSYGPFYVALGANLCTVVAVLSAWFVFGQADLSLKDLASIPVYILWKVPMYLKFFYKPETAWTRTARDPVS